MFTFHTLPGDCSASVKWLQGNSNSNFKARKQIKNQISPICTSITLTATNQTLFSELCMLMEATGRVSILPE